MHQSSTHVSDLIAGTLGFKPKNCKSHQRTNTSDRKVADDTCCDRKIADDTCSDRKIAYDTCSDRKVADDTCSDRKIAYDGKAIRSLERERERDRENRTQILFAEYLLHENVCPKVRLNLGKTSMPL